jgi:pyruvate dehydrogenase (quinone)
MVTFEQRGLSGDPRFDASQLLPAFPYADYARMLGLRGIRVDRPEQVSLAWEEALGSDRPTVLDMVVDRNVPPLPPHVTSKQARSYFSALWKGDPEALSVLKQTAREWWAGLKG